MENSTASKKSRPSKSKRKSEENSSSDTLATDEPAPETTTDVLKGVLEAIYLMYTAVQEKLRAQKEKEMMEGLSKKLSVTVRELMGFSQVIIPLDDHYLVLKKCIPLLPPQKKCSISNLLSPWFI